MQENLLYIVSLLGSSAVLIVLGIMMFLLRIPRNEKWQYLSNARNLLSLSYLILGISNIFEFFATDDGGDEMRNLILIAISYYQAVLFTGTALTFIRPLLLTRQKIYTQLYWVTCIVAMIFIPYHFYPNLYPAIFGCAVVLYIVQLITYTHVFRKQYQIGVGILEKYYDDEFAERLIWIRHLFYSALVIGILSLFMAILPISDTVYCFFIILYTLYYSYVMKCVVDYRQKGDYIVTVVTQKEMKGLDDDPDSNALPELEEVSHDQESLEPKGKDLELKIALEKWVEEEKYIESDVGIEDIVKELGTSQEELNSYFLTYKKILFRTWRMRLRIHKAEQILRDHPEVKIARLQEMVGVADKSNFFKQFKQETGMSPSVYRKYIHKE